MKQEIKNQDCCSKEKYFKKHHCGSHGGSTPIYCLGVIGALFYFLGNATSFGMVMIGIGKSFFWPAILMFKLLTYLQM